MRILFQYILNNDIILIFYLLRNLICSIVDILSTQREIKKILSNEESIFNGSSRISQKLIKLTQSAKCKSEGLETSSLAAIWVD